MTDLEKLSAKQEITEVLYAYCRGVDRLDEALVRNIYHEDAYDDHGYWKGRGVDFAPFVIDRLRRCNTGTTHSISNVMIEVEGDVATAESQVIVTLRRVGDTPQTVVDVMGARYVDRFSKRGGMWKIDERTVVLEWHKVETWNLDQAPIALEKFTCGRRDRMDAIYRMQQEGTLRDLPRRQVDGRNTN